MNATQMLFVVNTCMLQTERTLTCKTEVHPSLNQRGVHWNKHYSMSYTLKKVECTLAKRVLTVRYRRRWKISFRIKTAKFKLATTMGPEYRLAYSQMPEAAKPRPIILMPTTKTKNFLRYVVSRRYTAWRFHELPVCVEPYFELNPVRDLGLRLRWRFRSRLWCLLGTIHFFLLRFFLCVFLLLESRRIDNSHPLVSVIYWYPQR